ncbi:UNVERIFIED_CONTAM: hypothetical protein HDU68_012396, partial [Siphonaria sp. JEL0065]
MLRALQGEGATPVVEYIVEARTLSNLALLAALDEPVGMRVLVARFFVGGVASLTSAFDNYFAVVRPLLDVVALCLSASDPKPAADLVLTTIDAITKQNPLLVAVLMDVHLKSESLASVDKIDFELFQAAIDLVAGTESVRAISQKAIERFFDTFSSLDSATELLQMFNTYIVDQSYFVETIALLEVEISILPLSATGETGVIGLDNAEPSQGIHASMLHLLLDVQDDTSWDICTAIIEVMELVLQTADKDSIEILTKAEVNPQTSNKEKLTSIAAIDRLLKIAYFGQTIPHNIQADLDPYFFDALERKNNETKSKVKLVLSCLKTLQNNESNDTERETSPPATTSPPAQSGILLKLLQKIIKSMMRQEPITSFSSNTNHEVQKRQRSINLKISGLIGNFAWKIEGMEGFEFILHCLESLKDDITSDFEGPDMTLLLSELERYKTYTMTTHQQQPPTDKNEQENNHQQQHEFIINPAIKNVTLEKLEVMILLGEISREVLTILLVRGAE